MKLLNIKPGIAQNIYSILGYDGNTPSPDPNNSNISLTKWSIQSCMIENLSRILKAIVGDNECGRVMKGMVSERKSSNKVEVSPGIAFTRDGNLVCLETTLFLDVPPDIVDQQIKVYLLHKECAINPNTLPNSGGLNTTFVKSSSSENIVYDDLMSCYKNSVNDVSESVYQILSSNDSAPSTDCVLVGMFDSYQGISRYPYSRGFGPNDPTYEVSGNTTTKSTKTMLNGLRVINGAEFENDVTINGDSQLTVKSFDDSYGNVGQTYSIIVPGENNSKTKLYFKSGILTKVDVL